ncbi:MAG: DUF1993 family protein [Jaaginema sp. PMC 1079.18]|nr:DUF1993 family protein [Jaaginema sp. PMC 1080.18]MEC4849573.1 DUF1993 family protein [Jaaginema sp. PMC 1079.18]MEC4866568.1 DUF1993 family protein [Jaaginema sp. PMC 1078.18]
MRASYLPLLDLLDQYFLRLPYLLLTNINAEDEKLTEITRIDLSQDFYIELSGIAYANEFLIPNFYFHLVTAYDILRMIGVPIGKRDYMMHLVPFLKHA